MRNNIKLIYKEGLGDQKCIFWSPNKKLTGRRRKKEGEEEKEEEKE